MNTFAIMPRRFRAALAIIVMAGVTVGGAGRIGLRTPEELQRAAEQGQLRLR
jgi:hypothetical protein